MEIILFDHPETRTSLLPLTYTRPVAMMRCGILTIAEKWRRYGYDGISFLTQEYLRPKFPASYSNDNILVNGSVFPSAELSARINSMEKGEGLTSEGILIAARVDQKGLTGMISSGYEADGLKVSETGALRIRNTWDIFHLNGGQIKEDFTALTAGRSSAPIADGHTIVYGGDNVFLEAGVKIKAAVLNAEGGPIYLGRNSEIQEGALVRGPFALGESSVVNMGAKIRGDSTFGPFCKVGGEVGNSVIFGYSNKGHDGYMGNSVIGEWCNLGADTNTSNLKNTYMPVKVWSYGKEQFVNTGLQFCGLAMGDHSKCGINTMFNTGTVVGVMANIFGAGFPRAMVPSFSWGGAAGFTTFGLNKAFESAEAVMKRRNIALTKTDKDILEHIFKNSSQYRVWEKNGKAS